jgi:hypothetical protein
VELVKEPAGQDMQREDPVLEAKKPMAQGVHAVAADLSENCPRGQGVQVVEPFLGEKVPGRQELQLLLPWRAEKKPAPHCAHLLDPGVGAAVPGEQDLQANTRHNATRQQGAPVNTPSGAGSCGNTGALWATTVACHVSYSSKHAALPECCALECPSTAHRSTACTPAPLHTSVYHVLFPEPLWPLHTNMTRSPLQSYQ